jgi:predicted ATP-dependent endonuclease of OLD family
MKKLTILKHTLVTLTLSLALLAAASVIHAANLTDKDKQYLAAYEKARTALAADSLDAAKSTAGDLGDEGAGLAQSKSLDEARAAFEKLSARAKQLAADQSGYYVVHCPMLKKDWVQTTPTVANPYAGKKMLGCGEIRK